MKRSSSIGLVLAMAVGGCASGGFFDQRVTNQSVNVSYSPSQFSAFAAAGPLVEIRGAPPGGATPEEIAAALKLPGRWPQTPFRVVAPGEAPHSQRIVLLFGAPGGFGDVLLCRGDMQPVETSNLTAAAAFCRGGRAASGAKLTDVRAIGLSDPEFATAMTRLLSEMSPSRDPTIDTDNEIFVMTDD